MATVFVSSLTLPGSLISGENPQACFRPFPEDVECTQDGSLLPLDLDGYGAGCRNRVLPYRMQDRYTRGKEPVRLKTIVMENEHLRATFLPGFGGKLWSLFSKDQDRELLFVNPVFQPANLANRNAWTAGGIEWNLGHTGHFALTCDDLYCGVVQCEDGEKFLRMYEYEATHAQILQLDFHLPDGARQLGMHVRIENARGSDSPLYWWTNTAVRLTESTRVFSGTPEILYQLADPADKRPGFGRCKMPRQPNLPGIDISYPNRIPRSVEYFFQNDRTAPAPWEVSFEKDGRGLMERSTQPLFARKMFCWGTGAGGRHWCDYLSRPGQGDYIETQAGLAPTQLHTTRLPGRGCVSFTQMFGPFHAPQDAGVLEWNEALTQVERSVEETLSAAVVAATDRDYAAKATLRIEKMLHQGGFYGGLEAARRAKCGEPPMAPHLSFPDPEEGGGLDAWRKLLSGEPFPQPDSPLPYVTDPLWLPILKSSLKEAGNENRQGLLQYGVSLAENGDTQEAAAVLEKCLRQYEDPWAAHALGMLMRREGDLASSAQYLTRAYEMEGGRLDASFAEDALDALLKIERYERLWELFCGVPETERTEQMRMSALYAAVKLEQFDFLESAFDADFAGIREGAVALSELWFEYRARLEARKKGVAYTDALLDRSVYLPESLDFRMS